MSENFTAQHPRTPPDRHERKAQARTQLSSALLLITVLTLLSASALFVVILTSARAADVYEGVLIVSVLFGVPLSATLLSLLPTPVVRFTAVLTFAAVAAVTAGLTVSQIALNATPGACDLTPAHCGASLDSPTATILGAVCVGVGPVLIFYAIARSLRERSAHLVIVYLVFLPGFALWISLVTAVCGLLTFPAAIATD